MTEIEIIEKEYLLELQRIENTIKNNQNKAIFIVNTAKIINNYEIGTIINERKVWGNKYIEKLSNDLKKYGSGYSKTNLKYMSQFANTFSYDEISQRDVGQISWRCIITIMSKCETHKERLWYVAICYKNGWSRSVLLNQIAMKAYERSLITPSTTSIVTSNDLINEIYKDTYVFDFLDKENIKNEKDLKKQMINNIIKFLKELGQGFALIDTEYKVRLDSSDDYFIDILMYNTKVHCYVVIEVKIGKFHPKDVGQLMFYINAIDEIERNDNDNPTIGLLLCKDADTNVCKITLKNINIPISVSKYKFIEELPEYLEKRLREI